LKSWISQWPSERMRRRKALECRGIRECTRWGGIGCRGGDGQLRFGAKMRSFEVAVSRESTAVSCGAVAEPGTAVAGNGRVLVRSGERATIHRRGAEAQRGKPQNAKMLRAMQRHRLGGSPGGAAASWWQSHAASMTQIRTRVLVSG